MKKIMAAAVTSLLVLALVPGALAASKKQQKVEGMIALPAPFVDDSGCFAGLHRRTAIVTQENSSGLIGYNFDVDKKTWGKPFVLEASGGAGHVDLDIYFYQEFGTIEDVVSDPGGAGAPASVQFNTREAGGEAGIVPKKYNKVIICMYGGQLGAGFGANFVYTAGKGVKVPKA